MVHPIGGVDGSSPLARGLRQGPAADRRQAGIIPARAGFTRKGRSGGEWRGDHPRSRGVYLPASPLRSEPVGSSPLARGLPGLLLTHAHNGGIIPARAGFTSRTTRRPSTPQDHPRSRGVYVQHLTQCTGNDGSSPLARGLRARPRRLRRHRRIIPARAGFTKTYVAQHKTRPDHPRSRGVYVAILAGTHALGGSSPLARGLRVWKNRPKNSEGIIPARAGFTIRPL